MSELKAKEAAVRAGLIAADKSKNLSTDPVALGLIAAVVRDALTAKRRPSLHDVCCRALIAANAYNDGVAQLSRVASLAAPTRRASK